MFALKWDNTGIRLRVYVFERRKANGSLVPKLSNINQVVYQSIISTIKYIKCINMYQMYKLHMYQNV
jgi:hypothetical protein